MSLKRGITVTMMVITVMLMIILAGTITISTYSTVNYTKLSMWVNEITYIQDVVNEQIKTESTFNKVLETVSLDINELTSEEKLEQFAGETISSTNTVELQVLDLGKLGITNVSYGNGKTTNDVYAISPITLKVYYLQGIIIDNIKYYTLTDNLKSKFKLEPANSVLKSVVFVPSKIGYTNEPIAVTVKIPMTFTNIAISTSDSQISVGSQTTENNMYVYQINSNNIATNYTVTVTYNDETQTKNVSYKVTGYDNIKPIIGNINENNFVYKQTTNDRLEYLINITAIDESGIKYIKYDMGTIPEIDAYQHFKENGNFIIGGKINLDKTLKNYTIYAEDNAGNFSIVTFEKPKMKTLISTEAELLAALASGESDVKLIGNLECTSPINITGNHAIDLNGHILSYTINGNELPTDGETHNFTFITIEEGASLTVNDNSSAGSGKILSQILEETYNGDDSNRYNTLYTIQNKGTLTVESGEVASNLIQKPGEQKENIHSKCLAKTINNSGTVNLDGGEITSYIDSQGCSNSATRNSEGTAIGIENTGVVNLNSGIISSEAHARMEMASIIYGETRAYAYGITNSSTGTINNSGNVTITVSANAYKDNAYTTKKDSAEIKQN